MTPDRLSLLEVELIATKLRLREQERQLADLALAVIRLNQRLQLQEAGTALYEVANEIPRRGH